MHKRLFTLVVSAFALLVLSLQPSVVSATCFTCTETKPYQCIPAGSGADGYEECYAAPNYGCAMNGSLPCTGGSQSSLLVASRSIVVRLAETDAARVLGGAPVRVLRGAGGEFDEASLRAALGLTDGSEVEFVTSAFSLGAPNAGRDVTAWVGDEARAAVLDGFAGTRVAVTAGDDRREFRFGDGDLAVVATRHAGAPALLVISSERMAVDAPDVVERLTAIQQRFNATLEGLVADGAPAPMAAN